MLEDFSSNRSMIRFLVRVILIIILKWDFNFFLFLYKLNKKNVFIFLILLIFYECWEISSQQLRNFPATLDWLDFEEFFCNKNEFSSYL